MKIKQKPEDFLVEEILDLRLDPAGSHAVFRVEKRSMNTLDAVADLARKLGVHRSEVGFAGLKDKHSLAVQHFSVYGATGRDVEGASFRARFIGMSHVPVSSSSLIGNRFEITVRDLSKKQAASFAESMAAAAATGVPNYFDEQRFGSARHGQGFIAQRMASGDFEGALRLLIATPSRKDRSGIKAEMNLISQKWGDWPALKDHIRHDPQKRIVAHLGNLPSDFAGALDLVDPQFMSLYVNAWQSLLWNKAAARVVVGVSGQENVIRRTYKFGEYVFPAVLQDETAAALREIEIPLPGPGAQDAQGVAAEAMRSVLSAEGLDADSFRLHGVKARFRKGSRKLMSFPRDLHVGTPQPDDLDPGRRKLKCSFTLGSGSYATIVIKRASI